MASTVRRECTNRVAMSGLEPPSATRAATSCAAAVSASHDDLFDEGDLADAGEAAAAGHRYVIKFAAAQVGEQLRGEVGAGPCR